MAPGSPTDTLSHVDDGSSPAERRAPYLFLALAAHDPRVATLRIALDQVDEVVVGRGDPKAEIVREGRVRRVIVRSPDPWLSSTHARVVKKDGEIRVVDAGSKNGSAVSGERIDAATLADGDVVELGHTFFLFRRALPAAVGREAVVGAMESVSGAASLGVATLSPGFAERLGELSRVTRAVVPIVLEGETGTGKEVIARAIHAASGRTGEFVAVNCGALPATLIEAELFGAKKGAFSGAVEDRVGLVRAAHGGTLLLDEVGELSPQAQTALLRVLQEREVVPVGSARPVAVDVRFLSATHRPLDAMVECGQFRRDLWMRLAGYRVRLPPLRERLEDLGALSAALLARAGGALSPGSATAAGRSIQASSPGAPGTVSLTPKAARALFRCAWPGNVRQLEKALSTALALAQGQPISLEHLPEEVREATGAAKGLDEDDARIRERLVSALREHRGNVSAAARELGKARMQIQRWMKRFGLTSAQFERPR